MFSNEHILVGTLNRFFFYTEVTFREQFITCFLSEMVMSAINILAVYPVPYLTFPS